MTIIKEVYEDTRTDISFEEFEEKVKQKEDEMSGLVDTHSAALLIQQNMEEDAPTAIKDISKSEKSVSFTAKIVGIGNINTFNKSDDDEKEEGRVCNIRLADETGDIKGALWDKKADKVVNEFSIGDTVDIEGAPKSGHRQTEVNINSIQANPDANINLDIDEPENIADLTKHHQMVEIKGVVLSTTEENTFTRKDNSIGKVSNIILGDESGAITLTLWDKATPLVQAISVGDTIKITEGKTRTDNETNNLEIHITKENSIQPTEDEIEYQPNPTAIANVTEGDVETLSATIKQTEEINEFEKDDGSQGIVQNLQIKDDTGSIRATLWGENVDAGLSGGDEIVLVNSQIQEGWQDQLEVNVGYKSSVYKPAEEQNDDPENTTDSQTVVESTIINRTNTTDQQVEQKTEPEADDGLIEVKGVVIGLGDECTLDTDTGQQKVIPPEDGNMRLGQNITARGEKQENGVIDAEEIF